MLRLCADHTRQSDGGNISMQKGLSCSVKGSLRRPLWGRSRLFPVVCVGRIPVHHDGQKHITPDQNAKRINMRCASFYAFLSVPVFGNFRIRSRICRSKINHFLKEVKAYDPF